MTTSVPVTAAQGRPLFTCELSIGASTTYQTFHDCWSGEMGRISTVQIWDAMAGFGDHVNSQVATAAVKLLVAAAVTEFGAVAIRMACDCVTEDAAIPNTASRASTHTAPWFPIKSAAPRLNSQSAWMVVAEASPQEHHSTASGEVGADSW